MMDYFEIEGKDISSEELTIPKAVEALGIVTKSNFCTLEKVLLMDNGNETIVFTSENEVPQFPKNDIRKKERIGIEFSKSDSNLPKIWALRKSFPLIPHINLEINEYPRSLCLYDVSYDELKINWTGFRLIERIREWLKLSALGNLHQNDQPLEPLLIANEGNIILPIGLKNGDKLNVYCTSQEPNGSINLIATKNNYPFLTHHPVHFEVILGQPQNHGVIRHIPRNILELSNFLLSAGIDLKDYLSKLVSTQKDIDADLNNKIIFIFYLPKKRNEEDTVYSWDAYGVYVFDTIAELGLKLGILEKFGSQLVKLFNVGKASDSVFEELKVGILKPHFEFNKEMARRLNGRKETDDPKIVAIGLGAIGSEIFMNCIRAGYGKWVLIDDDIFLPHNMARHALGYFDVGIQKVERLEHKANQILGENASKAIVANIIKDNSNETISAAFDDADIILDMTASTAATKSIAKINKTKARIVSIFLNPSGSDLVVLAEDILKANKIASIEVQYYRALLYLDGFEKHLHKEQEPIRYSTSCRDLSSTISQDDIAHHSAIASKFIKRLNSKKNASICIWTSDDSCITTDRVDVKVFDTVEIAIGDWTVIYDKWLIEKIYSARSKKLPNETGGILIGCHNMEEKKVYAVDTILSPGDSIEYPTAYIRGIKDVRSNLDIIENRTAGALSYIGEWHSHPEGCSSKPSQDDRTLFKWLKKHMEDENLPPLMLIAGANDDFTFYLNSIK